MISRLLGAAVVLLGSAPVKAQPPDFEKVIAPILARSCLECHNPSEAKGKLDLTRREGLLKGGKDGPAIEPGKPDESYLIERVTDGSMPPKAEDRLTEKDVALLHAWVKAGARWPDGRVLSPFELTTDKRAGLDWWSLRPIPRPPLPVLSTESSVLRTANPIDHFIYQKLAEKHLHPAPEADRLTLIRRVTFDLIGLPPTPDEVDRFINDPSADAYEKLVDRLLASPHYGERWARHWLDIARFGESDGFENDKLREHSWPYRDYVIKALNEDRPYTQFMKEQLAGDVLEPVTRDGIAATGFLVAGPWDEIQNVGNQTEKRRALEDQYEELIGTVAQAFLGLTVNCARCHDHKFDPIPQSDYYRLKAVFAGVDHGNRPLFTPDEQRQYEAKAAPLRTRINELKGRLDALTAGSGDATLSRTDAKPLVEGRFGKALDAKVAHATTRSRAAYHTPPITVECWAKVFSKTGFNILVANNVKTSGEHWELYTYVGSGGFSAFLPGYSPSEIKSERDITDGQWHHVAMTFDGKTVCLFVDAKQVHATAVKRVKPPGPIDRLSIGAFPPQKIGCDGVVDEVRVSQVIRKIDAVPTGPFSVDEATLGLWHLDEIQDGKFADSVEPPAKPQAATVELKAELKMREAELTAIPASPMVYAGVRRQPEPTHLLDRGEIDKPAARVTPGGLFAVSPELSLPTDAPEAQRRLAFAEWLSHPANPLPARVLVNRVWHYHFGQGLVDQPSDLGFNGGRPSHPELLDYLAARFIDDGWSLKKLHRRIVTSSTYRQSSRFTEKAAAIDADDRLLWRFAPRRLEAEAVRDAMLVVSGELNPQMHGPSFRPFTVTVFNTYFYHLFDKGTPEFNRRTLYRFAAGTGKSPFLDALDCPAPALTTPRRRVTTTPLQALALMNDSFVIRQAAKFAERVRAAGDVEKQVALAYRLALGRAPTAQELEATAAVARTEGVETACWALLNASEFVYVR